MKWLAVGVVVLFAAAPVLAGKQKGSGSGSKVEQYQAAYGDLPRQADFEKKPKYLYLTCDQIVKRVPDWAATASKKKWKVASERSRWEQSAESVYLGSDLVLPVQYKRPAMWDGPCLKCEAQPVAANARKWDVIVMAQYNQKTSEMFEPCLTAVEKFRNDKWILRGRIVDVSLEGSTLTFTVVPTYVSYKANEYRASLTSIADLNPIVSAWYKQETNTQEIETFQTRHKNSIYAQLVSRYASVEPKK